MVNAMALVVNEIVERSEDWNEYDYQDILRTLSTEIDKAYSIFAASYNENLELLSDRVVAGQHGEIIPRLPLDPLSHAEFVQSIRDNQNGEIVLQYERGANDTTPMYVFYQWYPNKASYQKRVLFVVGITHDSVTTHTESWIRVGLILLLVITCITNTIFIILLRYLSQIFSRRKGMKWRKGDYEQQ
jgi:hypothetical protein